MARTSVKKNVVKTVNYLNKDFNESISIVDNPSPDRISWAKIITSKIFTPPSPFISEKYNIKLNKWLKSLIYKG